MGFCLCSVNDTSKQLFSLSEAQWLKLIVKSAAELAGVGVGWVVNDSHSDLKVQSAPLSRMLSEETLKVFINLTQLATVSRIQPNTNRAFRQAQLWPLGVPGQPIRWLSLPAKGSFSHKLGLAVLSVHLSVFWLPTALPQLPEKGRAAGPGGRGCLGKCPPKCRNAKVPVLTCIMGPSRLGRHCEEPDFVPLQDL